MRVRGVALESCVLLEGGGGFDERHREGPLVVHLLHKRVRVQHDSSPVRKESSCGRGVAVCCHARVDAPAKGSWCEPCMCAYTLKNTSNSPHASVQRRSCASASPCCPTVSPKFANELFGISGMCTNHTGIMQHPHQGCMQRIGQDVHRRMPFVK